MVAIALIARAPITVALLLGVSMLGLQFCIGAVNDLCDHDLDARTKPGKPIPAGLVTRREAGAVALIAAGMAFVLGLALRPDPLLLGMTAWMLGAGLVYDVWLKPTSFGWLCFAAAFPVLPLFAWYGATGGLPPRWEILLPVAALAGLALQLANGLVDLESDRAAGLGTLPVRLGRRWSLAATAILMATIHGLAALTLARGTSFGVVAIALAAAALAVVGLALSARDPRTSREFGWSLQAASIAVLGAAWLLSAAP